MSTCPSCNKFCSLNMEEPENNNLEVTMFDPNEEENTRTVTIQGEIRICLTSGCCGDEMKEYTFEPEAEIVVKGHCGDDCDITVVENSLWGVEESGGRYQKSYYGFSMECELQCECGKDVEIDAADCAYEAGTGCFTLEDKVAASEMDECN